MRLFIFSLPGICENVDFITFGKLGPYTYMLGFLTDLSTFSFEIALFSMYVKLLVVVSHLAAATLSSSFKGCLSLTVHFRWFLKLDLRAFWYFSSEVSLCSSFHVHVRYYTFQLQTFLFRFLLHPFNRFMLLCLLGHMEHKYYNFLNIYLLTLMPISF